MKKILMMLLVTVTSSLAAQASTNVFRLDRNADLHLTLKLGDVSDVSHAMIEEKIAAFVEANVPATSELDCTISVTASVNVGVAQFEVEVSVSGPCDEIARSGKKIATQILNQVTSMLKGKQ